MENYTTISAMLEANGLGVATEITLKAASCPVCESVDHVVAA